MKGLGLTLKAALNPLDQSAAAQFAKLGKAGLDRFRHQAMFMGKALTSKQYWQGQHVTGITKGAPRWTSYGAEDAGSVLSPRMWTAGGVGAWAGLNVLDPGATSTKVMNTAAYGVAAMGAHSLAVGAAARWPSSPMAEFAGKYTKWGAGGAVGAHILGII